MALTTKKKRFADALSRGANPTEAAIHAGYSEKTARVKGWQLSNDPEVKKYLKAVTPDVTFQVTKPKKVTKKVTEKVTPERASINTIEMMDNGLPDPIKAMGRILIDNMDTDPKLALDAAFKLAQFTHRKIGSIGKKEVKKLNAASVSSNRFPIPKPPTGLKH
ncbi:TPA: terminase small subunit [Escherichia coli]|uniref:terminase small subunit n=1 Tax=Escherichia coli TaxID=562 RepID=UPI000B503940|nr:terminase small subunit [Escherichia coli]ELP2865206.1 terminase small subunit [Escherichia coli O33]EEX2893645.1 terminase small subunit [Escherichia coli]EFC9771674.1 terminase small subunit [Escherichia coli]EFG3192744.1 terminase small subunit [Escherichia coli]EFH3542373.1 terminase small subunit [Escherichia coli]